MNGIPVREARGVSDRDDFERYPNGTASAVEILVLWGGDALHAFTLTNHTKRFVLGSAHALDSACFQVEPALLGALRWQLVEFLGDNTYVHIPERAHATSSLLDAPDVEATHVSGSVALPLGARLVVALGPLLFEITHHRAEAAWKRQFTSSEAQPIVSYFSASFVSVAALLTSAAFFVPPLGLNDGEATDHGRVILLQQYLEASAERELKEEPAPVTASDPTSGGSAGARAAGAEGSAGKPTASRDRGKLAVLGPRDNPTPNLSPREMATQFGMIGILAGGVLSDAPNTPWQRDAALGSDALSAQGALFGDELKDSFGAGGLGLVGVSEGGGGPYQGIGMTGVGTIGSVGNCVGSDCNGFGNHHGRLPGTHAARGPRVRASEVSTSGRLPADTIRRIVRQNFGRFRMCYEQGLARNPNLAGRVQVRFLIDARGRIGTVANGGSALPDASVVSCVVRAFYGLSFPKPESGSVQVNYPLSFSPE